MAEGFLATFVNTSLGPEQHALGPSLSVVGSGNRIDAGFGDGYDIGLRDETGLLVRRNSRKRTGAWPTR